MTVNKKYDAVIIGAGHNGLAAAAYLARKGKSVKVLERRYIVGGAAVTEEIIPGFRNSTCSYFMSILHPKIIADLELEKYGLKIHKDENTALALGSDNTYLFMNDDDDYLARQLAAAHPDDVDNFWELHDLIEAIADVLREVSFDTPPNFGGSLADLWRAGKLANRLRKLSPEQQAEAAKMFTMSVRDYVEQWLCGPLIQAMMAYAGQVGSYQSVKSGGTAYVVLHHMFGLVNGKKGAWAHIHGGMGGITQAMAKSAEAFGADIEVNAPVANVIIENGKAVGVKLEDGREFHGKAIVSNTHPQVLFKQLVAEEHVPAAFTRSINNYRSISGTFRMNLALDKLPTFTCLEGKDERDYLYHLQGSVFLCNSLDYCEQAYQDAQKYGWSRKPVIQMAIPSIIDDSLAPEGKHVASMFCQHFNYNLPDGQSWDDVREEVADHIIDTMTEYAPDLKESVLGRRILSPLDLEREFSLIGGDIFHGTLQMDQMFAMRPVPGYADYRMPIKNLYLCGSGTHPGGGVGGICGHNAAREVLKDL